MYFDKLICMVTIKHSEISTNTMHQYVARPTSLKTMMHIISDELDRRTIVVDPDATEARHHYEQDVNIKLTNTITENQTSH